MEIRENILLSIFTSIKIGGRARYFCEPGNIDELREALAFARTKKLPIFILGGGTNIIVKDSGFAGIAIKLSGSFRNIERKDSIISAGGGALLSSLINTAISFGLSGLTNLSGIPGTVGGAIVGNAGAFLSQISDCLISVNVFTKDGEEQVIKEPKFLYRDSNLRDKIILRGDFSLKPEAIWRMEEKRQQILEKRSAGQPVGKKTAGCIFKNPHGISAGELIEKTGLSGFRVGEAVVCEKHKNFIENMGNARGVDVFSLIKIIKEKVHNLHKINLEEEVIIV
ncbi:UDP-N-acetylmuramate dehydrogenase [bacterium]|nr:UDP-N-acetylmuramate dehydrogenase [bacterium]